MQVPEFHLSYHSILSPSLAIRDFSMDLLKKTDDGGRLSNHEINIVNNDESGYLSEASSEPKPGAVRVSSAGHLFNLQHQRPHDDDHAEKMYDDGQVDMIYEEIGLPTAVKAERSFEESDQFRETATKEAEQQILANLTPAEEYERSNGSSRSGRRRYWIYAIAFVVVIGAVVLITVLTSSANKNEEESSPIPPATLSPTTSADLCEDALELPQPISITGTTVNATLDRNLDTCGDITSNGIGVWYFIEGTGTRMSVSTCNGANFDTQISVFSGSNCFGGLKCEYGNDQRANCGQDASQLIFFAEEGVRYYLMVHGLRRAAGIFSLTVEPLQDNDVCITATRFEDFGPGVTHQVTVFGSNRFSTTMSNDAPACGVLSPGPGSWFVFAAKDTRFVQARVDDFPSNLLSVYSGDGCGNLKCIDSSEGFVMWTAIRSTDYYIFVHGKGSSVGDFALTLLHGGLLAPDLDDQVAIKLPKRCDLAFTLDEALSFESRVVIFGFTKQGEVANVPSCGNLVVSDSKGLWYTFTGSGNEVLVSTCETTSVFDTRISVFTGGCSTLSCVGGGDDNCGDHGFVNFVAERDFEYFILVHGTDNRVGNFTLSVDEVSLIIIPPDTCDKALPITLDGIGRLGTVSGAQFQDVGLCRDIDLAARSIYYTVLGTGSTMIASTCNQLSDTSAQIQLYGGSCDNLECIDNLKVVNCGPQMSVIWDSIVNQTYFIQVYGSENGTISLSVEEIAENYVCEDSSTSLEIGSSVLGSTRISQSDDGAFCSQAGNEPGSWYRVSSVTNGSLSVSACSIITNFNPQISVYDSCGSLQCLASNNGMRCGDGSAVTWTTSAGKIYYIVVRGSGENEFGNFALTLGPGNNLCEIAEPVQPDGVGTLGSTLQATMDEGSLSCFASGIVVDGPAVWYKVIGTGGLLEASTCTTDTDFDTKLSVYQGTCGELSCIVGNDNSCGSKSSLTWFASEQEIYYILVHGFETGNFGLIVRTVENDSCASSLSLKTDSSVIVADSSTNSSFPYPCTSSTIESQLFWYDVIGTGGEITVDACAGSSTLSQVSVFASGCNDLSCSDLTIGGCSISFDSVYNQEYHILVSDREGESFELFLNSSNYECESAFGPLSVGGSVRGSTGGSSVDVAETCGSLSSRGAGVWYYFIGTGLPVTAFTCDSFTDFDTQISVYSGYDCGSLKCVGAKDDNCGLQTWMMIPTVEGEKYYILISGKGTSNGNFVLSIR